jgi:membrane fusion protein (multidrug efflux system)
MRMRRLVRRLVLVGILLAAAAAGLAWYLRPRDVTVTTVVRRPVAEIVYATGVVEPVRWAKVVPQVREHIVDLCQCEGRAVKAGDVLARQDDRIELDTLAELEARHAQAARDYDRLLALSERGVASRAQLEQAQTSRDSLRALIGVQKNRIAQLVLRAPVDGVVLREDGKIGEIVGTSDVLFWVGQPKPLQVVAEVNEEDVPRVAVGQKVLLRNDGFAGRALPATVASITPKGDPVNKTFRIYLSLPDDTPLRIGMSIEANIVVRETSDALVIPPEALAGDSVFVVEGDRVVKRTVVIGLRGARAIEVREGLAEGERVVAPASDGLKPGQRVRVPGDGA